MMYRVLTRGDDGDVIINGKTYYSITTHDLARAKKICSDWEKTTPSFIQQLMETKTVEVWEDLD